MASRSLELNIMSANHLSSVNLFMKMKAYAVVSIGGGTGHNKNKVKTSVDRCGGSNPTWNHAARFAVDESLLHQNRLTLIVKLKCRRVLGDRDVGQVVVPVKELFDSNPPPATENNEDVNSSSRLMKFLTYQVRTPSGKPKGSLSFSYRFADSVPDLQLNVMGKPTHPIAAYPEPGKPAHPVAMYPNPGKPAQPVATYPNPRKPDEPVTAYPAQAAGPSYSWPGYAYPPPPYGGYPQPPAQAGYSYHPAPGYGYPPGPAGPGYGYRPAMQPQKNNKFGMGLGAGLLGGMLGGMLIGDMVSDTADFGDGGGFDF